MRPDAGPFRPERAAIAASAFGRVPARLVKRLRRAVYGRRVIHRSGRQLLDEPYYLDGARVRRRWDGDRCRVAAGELEGTGFSGGSGRRHDRMDP
jgi:hypothetical protein